MAEFRSAVGAALAARAIGQGLDRGDIGLGPRIGLNLGDVVDRDGDLSGDGVNVAARLQAGAEPSASSPRQRLSRRPADGPG